MSNDLSIRSDQWDIRINIRDQAELDLFLLGCQEFCDMGSVRYLHVSGLERTGNSSHVHVALILFNYTSKRSIVRRFGSTTGYYIEPRDKTKSLLEWVIYHSKSDSKVDPSSGLVFVFGQLPAHREKRSAPMELTPREAAKRAKKAEDWARKKHLMVMHEWDLLDEEFPGFIYSSMGQSMKREVMKQSNDFHNATLRGELNNYIIWGASGTGKSSSVALLYPNCYKKQKGTQFWDSYDKTNPDHAVVWIDEMSKETLKTIAGKSDGGFEFLKELADRYAVTVDEKFTKGYKIRPKSIIITMNEHPTSLLPDRAVEINKQALYRKFKIMHVEVSWCDLVREWYLKYGSGTMLYLKYRSGTMLFV